MISYYKARKAKFSCVCSLAVYEPQVHVLVCFVQVYVLYFFYICNGSLLCAPLLPAFFFFFSNSVGGTAWGLLFLWFNTPPRTCACVLRADTVSPFTCIGNMPDHNRACIRGGTMYLSSCVCIVLGIYVLYFFCRFQQT